MQKSGMGVFERYLTLWVLLCIVVGIGLGQAFPGVARTIGAWEVARVNLPVGLLIWVMIVPMLLRVDFTALGEVRHHLPDILGTALVDHQHGVGRFDHDHVLQPDTRHEAAAG